MTKKERLKELSNLIKETYNLDVVTTAHTKAQQHKLDMGHNPDVVIFKMRYRLKGGDVAQNCPISWLVIDGIDWEHNKPFRKCEDESDPEFGQHVDLMVRLIVKTCGEVLAKHPDVKRTLSSMAKNAELRSKASATIESISINDKEIDGNIISAVLNDSSEEINEPKPTKKSG